MAIKMYRIALDQIPPTSKELRLKIQRNIGNALVRLGQFQDAINAFESILEVAPEIQVPRRAGRGACGFVCTPAPLLSRRASISSSATTPSAMSIS